MSRAAGDWTTEPIEPTRECAAWLPEALCPTQDADRLVARALAVVEPGTILILHDGHDRVAGVDPSGPPARSHRAQPETQIFVQSLLPRAAEYREQVESVNAALLSLADERGLA